MPQLCGRMDIGDNNGTYDMLNCDIKDDSLKYLQKSSIFGKWNVGKLVSLVKGLWLHRI